MNETYRTGWAETRRKFQHWWKNENTGRPLMWITAPRETPLEPPEKETPFPTPEAFHTDVEENSRRYRNFCRQNDFYAEAFPNFDLNIGAGSMALYLGAEPDFRWDTIWFKENLPEGWEGVPPLRFDPENRWLLRHLGLIKRAHELAAGDYLVTIPDIVENIDILAAMRGPQETCYDLCDCPEEIERRIAQVDELYFQYYDRFYELVREPDGSSSYTAFRIWGPGKTAKIQCDFCALMSPGQFRSLIVPSLRRQCQRLDNAIYHLDGPDAVRHLDALLEIEELNGIQWTHGAGHPDGIADCWYEPILDKVTKAGKNLLLFVEDGDCGEWIEKTDRLVGRYGTRGLYLQYPEMSRRDAQRLLEHADKYWK